MDLTTPNPPSGLMASFPGQKGTGSPLPNSPLNLAVTGVTISSVSLSWDVPIGGALTYNLYRNGIQVQSGISSTFTTDTGLTAGTSYTYYVTSQTALGEGSRSNSAIGSTGVLPNAPQSLAITGTTSSTVSLGWSTPVGGASSYNLYRNGTKVQSGISGTSTTDTGLSASTGYNYKVSATNSFGEGPQSNQVTGTTLPSGVARSWFPSWNGDFNTTINKNGTVSNVTFETDLVGTTPGMNGYNFSVTWSFLEPSKDNYNLAGLMSLYNKMASYSPARHTSLTVQVGAFTSTHPGANDDSVLPLYLQQDVATYGQSGWRITSATLTSAPAAGATSATLSSSWPAPSQTVSTRFGTGETKNVAYTNGSTNITFPAMVATQTSTTITFSVTTQPAAASGWWGGNGNGNTYAAMLHKPNVNARFLKLAQWIGSVLNSLPLFDVLIYQENSFWIGAVSSNGSGSGYTDALATTSQNDWCNAAVAALPNKNVSFENTFMFQVTPCQQFETTLINAQCMPGQTDTRGQTFVNAANGTLPTWGMAAYGGVQLSGSTATVQDWRPGVHTCCQIEAPDLGAFGGVSGGSIPVIFNSIPLSGATSAQIAPSFNGNYWPNGTGYVIRFATTGGSVTRSCTVSDEKTFVWTGGLGSSCTSATQACVQGGANGWTPQDIADCVNGGMSCSYAYLAVIPGSATYVAVDRRWPQASATVLSNPIVNTSYPTNYPS